MSLTVCIPDLIAKGKITGATAKEAERIYGERFARLRHALGDANARAQATQETVQALEFMHSEKKRLSLMALEKQAEILYNSRRKFAGGKFADGPIKEKALLAHLIHQPNAPGIRNVDMMADRIKMRTLQKVYGILSYRRDILGELRHKAEFDEVIKVMHGDKSDDLNVRELAEANIAAIEDLRLLGNSVGPFVHKRKNYGIPHRHDAQRIGSVPFEKWRDDVVNEFGLDRRAIIDDDTGLPMGDARLEFMLKQMYERIKTDGAIDATPSSAPRGLGVFDPSAERRVLEFKDGAAWLAYNERYGATTPYDALMTFYDRKAMDIALKTILGPNPRATLRWMQSVLQIDNGRKGTFAERGKAKGGAINLGYVFDQLTGANQEVYNMRAAMFMSGLRNYATAKLMGGAVINSFSDIGSGMVMRRYNGLAPSRMFQQSLRAFVRTPENLEIVRRSFILSEELVGRLNGNARAGMDEIFGHRIADAPQDQGIWAGVGHKVDVGLHAWVEFTARIADATIRAGLLNKWTITRREINAMSLYGSMTTYADKTFSELNPNFRRFLDRYGLNESDWDQIRKSERIDFGGTNWISPNNIKGELSDRVFEAVLSEVEYGTPSKFTQVQAWKNAGARGGPGELLRTPAQFMTFAIGNTMMQWGRMMEATTITNRAMYATYFAAATTFYGGISLILNDILNGKDPREVFDGGMFPTPQFTAAAFVKGGGGGWFADMINTSMEDEYGRNAAEALIGASVDTPVNLIDFANGKERKVKGGAKGEKETIFDVAKLAKQETPVVGKLWYTRLVYERLLIDQLSKWQGDDIEAARKRKEKRAADDRTQFAWRPGQLTPDRAPDFSNIFGKDEAEGAAAE